MFSIFSPIIADQDKTGGCYYYRVKTPLNQLSNMYDVNSGLSNQTANKHAIIQAMIFTDIVHIYNPDKCRPWVEALSSVSNVPVQTAPNGKVKMPPIFVYDSDDNTDFVSPFNQAFANCGVRNIDGTLLSPGDILSTVDENGEDVPLWVDGQTFSGEDTFNIKENLEKMKYRHALIRNSAGATCSSPELMSYYKDVLGVKNVHLYYNTIVPNDYNSTIVAKRNDPANIVRIFWQGGQSHLHDWMPLKDSVRFVMDKYPNTKWVFFGNRFDFLTNGLPPERVEYHNWCSTDAYHLKRTLLNVDINLCPLSDNIFNRAKSAVKWYESAVSPNFEATLAANVGPYKEITDGVNGLLYNSPEEFVSKLSLLIEDAELRNRLGEGARHWVMNNRLPQHTIPGLYDFYNELLAQNAADKSPKIIPATPKNIKEALSNKR